ncbi:MAG: hypothetical protein SVV80_14000, partial [Planctomycetota bacterium]|nr:hypothetical protein [Planctomycetota bacterium]
MNKLVRGMLVLAILAAAASITVAEDPVFPEEWKSLDVAGLTALARQFVAQGAAGVDNCKLLAAYVAQRYAADAAENKVDWNEWLDLGSLLGTYYPKATQEAMAKDMQQKLAPDQEAVSKLTDEQLKKTCKALVKLRQFDIGSAIFVTWAKETNAWQSWDPEGLGWLVYILGEAREAGKEARLRLLEHISGKYLTDNTAIRSVPGESWKFFAEYLYGELSPDTRTQWITKLRAAFPDMDALKPREAAYNVWTLRILGDSGVGARTAKWMEGSAAWKSWGAWELDRLAEVLSDSGEAGKAARVSLAGQITTKYMVDK